MGRAMICRNTHMMFIRLLTSTSHTYVPEHIIVGGCSLNLDTNRIKACLQLKRDAASQSSQSCCKRNLLVNFEVYALEVLQHLASLSDELHVASLRAVVIPVILVHVVVQRLDADR